MKPLKRYAPWVALVLLPIVGLYAVYWLLFCMWRSAADTMNSAMWRHHVYGWFALCVALLVLLIADAVHLFRPKRKRVRCIPPTSAHEDSDDGERNLVSLEHDIKFGEMCMICIALLTLVVNIFIGMIYYGQLREMQRATQLTANAVQVARDTLSASQLANVQQSIDNATASARSQTAANASAELSSRSLQATIDNFHREQRAWIEFGTTDTTALGSVDGTPLFTYSIFPKNIGKTMASKLRILVINPNGSHDLATNQRGIELYQEQLFRQQIDPLKHVVFPYANGPQTLAPSEQSSAPIYTAGSAPRDGNFSYVIGKVTYRDVFGLNHWKRFCLLVASASGRLSHCQYGNDEDSETDRKKSWP